jgi:hypothetical protein
MLCMLEGAALKPEDNCGARKIVGSVGSLAFSGSVVFPFTCVLVG